jgi:LysM repeat protein
MFTYGLMIRLSASVRPGVRRSRGAAHRAVPGVALLTALAAALVLVPVVAPATAAAQTLRGGAASLDRQNAQAQAHNFTSLRTPADVRRYVELGYLVPVVPNRDFDLANVSFPYARPEVRLFIERLANQYRSACGEKLVVTSLTRPQSNQPWNASSRSVHPTGMAVDLRRSQRAQCRNWLERVLLSLEGQGLVEAIYERNPPHYHVAVYPRPYAQYVARITGSDPVVAQAVQAAAEVELRFVNHRVARGETLATIAQRHGVAVSRLRAENGIRGDRILAGQELRIPVYRPVESTRVAEAPATATARADVADADAALDAGEDPAGALEALEAEALHHTVRRGESLWAIARRHGITVDDLARANGIRGSRIQPGQVLEVPVAR